jgi:hypothetical protein
MMVTRQRRRCSLVRDEKRKVTMASTNSQTFLSALWAQYRTRFAAGPQIGRRTLLKSGTGIAVVSAVGLSELLELLTNREAFAAGMVIPLVGVTREPFMDPEETPHRHTFSARFQVTDVSPTAIMGTISGRTARVISTGSEKEDQHFHIIRAEDVSLEQLILSGPEDNEEGEHTHQVSIE